MLRIFDANELTGRKVLGRGRGEEKLALETNKVEYIRKSVQRLYAFLDREMANTTGSKWRRVINGMNE